MNRLANLLNSLANDVGRRHPCRAVTVAFRQRSCCGGARMPTPYLEFRPAILGRRQSVWGCLPEAGPPAAERVRLRVAIKGENSLTPLPLGLSVEWKSAAMRLSQTRRERGVRLLGEPP